MKKYGCIGFICFCVLSFLLIASFPARGQEGKAIRLKYANFFPPASAHSKLFEQWGGEVEKRTNGRVKISFFHGATLVPLAQTYDAVTRGIADISFTYPGLMPGRFPLSDALYLPTGVKTASIASKMFNEWFKKFRPKEYDDVKVFYFYSTPMGYFMTLKPLPSIKDLKGLKIKTTGLTTPFVSALDGIPVSALVTDVYEALMTGVVEGVILPGDSLVTWKLADLIRGIQFNPGMLYPSPMLPVMNKSKWNSLPPDIQKIIEEVNVEAAERAGKEMDKEEKKAIEFAVSKGAKVFNISPEEIEVTKARMKPLFDNYLKRTKEKGLPGEESLKFLLDYIKAHQ